MNEWRGTGLCTRQSLKCLRPRELPRWRPRWRGAQSCLHCGSPVWPPGGSSPGRDRPAIIYGRTGAEHGHPDGHPARAAPWDRLPRRSERPFLPALPLQARRPSPPAPVGPMGPQARRPGDGGPRGGLPAPGQPSPVPLAPSPPREQPGSTCVLSAQRTDLTSPARPPPGAPRSTRLSSM